jgi:hypothetical protein
LADAQKLYHSVICFFASLYFGLLSQNLRSLDFAITLIATQYHSPTMGASAILPFREVVHGTPAGHWRQGVPRNHSRDN